jgi:ankyrin repeat protein
MSSQLPARPNLEHLRNEARQRLGTLRRDDPRARLSDAQLLVARAYGFASWRQLKASVDERTRRRIFEAARIGDVDTVRRALAAGFHTGTVDETGRTIHQIAKTLGHTDLELLMREHQERDERHRDVKRAVAAIHAAAAGGQVDELRRLLELHPDLIDARGVDHSARTALHQAAWNDRLECVRVLLDGGADVTIRDYEDNASALHGAARYASVAIVRLLVEAGADVIGAGDDHQLGVLGWATCLGRVREDVAAYLLQAGATLDIWSAIALDRTIDVRRFTEHDRGLRGVRMSRSEHRRTPLHHAAALNRSGMVRLLIDLSADVNAADDTGATPLTVAALHGSHPAVVAVLEQAGARLDLLTAVSLERYDVAARMLQEDPARLGPDGRDTIALHVAVAGQKTEVVRWLIAHGVDVNAKRRLWDCEATPLHITAEHGLVALAQLLLEAGADPGIRDDKYNATVLEWAEYCAQPRIAELLRARGVNGPRSTAPSASACRPSR